MPSVSPILNLRNEKLNVKLHEYQTMVYSVYVTCEKSADLPVHQGSVISIFLLIIWNQLFFFQMVRLHLIYVCVADWCVYCLVHYFDIGKQYRISDQVLQIAVSDRDLCIIAYRLLF